MQLTVSGDEQTRLEADATYIKQHQQKIYESITAIGKRLIEVQARLKDDSVFVAWMRVSFDFSVQTAYNYMSVARRLENAEIAPQTPLRVLYDACKPSANDEAVEALKSGEDYSADGWYILSNAPQYLIDSWRAKRIDEQEAKEAAQYLRGKAIHPDVKTYALTYQVHHIETMRYLNTARLDHDRTGGERTTWTDLQDTNGYLSAMTQGVHVSFAREPDLARYRAERQALHRETAHIQYDWLQFHARVVIVGGKPLLDISSAQATFTENDRLFLKLRIRR